MPDWSVPLEYRASKFETLALSIGQKGAIQLIELIIDFGTDAKVGLPVHSFGLWRYRIERICISVAKLSFQASNPLMAGVKKRFILTFVHSADAFTAPEILAAVKHSASATAARA